MALIFEDAKDFDTMSNANQQISFEAAIEQLQSTVKKLESGDLSLDDSLKTFEEGIRLSRLCQEQLQTAEKRVEILMKASSGDAPELQPFTSAQANHRGKGE